MRLFWLAFFILVEKSRLLETRGGLTFTMVIMNDFFSITTSSPWH
ncbi:hypothetical protein C789_217 [Microcystis aeruginosa FACHB-905 = DIANCHI905]|nr:hypothetical protein C789_217 [Microcystis aeruginosa FACHB-905 = DIANCHI905]